MSFFELERITSEKIAEVILELLKQNNIPAVHVQSCSDMMVPAKMSSGGVGVHVCIMKEAPCISYLAMCTALATSSIL